MSTTENTLEGCLLSSEHKHQALKSTEPNDYKEPISPQSPIFTEVMNSLHGPDASLNAGMEVQGASSSAPLPVINDSKTLQKIKTAPDF